MSIRAPRRSPHGDADPVLHRHRRIAEMRRWQSRSRRREGDRVLGLPRHSQSKLPRRPQSPDREPSFGSGASSAKGSRSLAREVDSCTVFRLPARYFGFLHENSTLEIPGSAANRLYRKHELRNATRRGSSNRRMRRPLPPRSSSRPPNRQPDSDQRRPALRNCRRHSCWHQRSTAAGKTNSLSVIKAVSPDASSP
jgi:hypothetical protein